MRWRRKRTQVETRKLSVLSATHVFLPSLFLSASNSGHNQKGGGTIQCCGLKQVVRQTPFWLDFTYMTKTFLLQLAFQVSVFCSSCFMAIFLLFYSLYGLFLHIPLRNANNQGVGKCRFRKSRKRNCTNTHGALAFFTCESVRSCVDNLSLPKPL